MSEKEKVEKKTEKRSEMTTLLSARAPVARLPSINEWVKVSQEQTVTQLAGHTHTDTQP